MITGTVFIRLLSALVLGGIIGIEREGIRRPAGLRTHILVCVSSALVMISGIYLTNIYIDRILIDPSRFGAQVISGIGFLGAGTILKVNNGVKGLTTAASLWSVAGIGLACGIGFYSGAILCTLLILFSLKAFSKIERLIKNKNHEAWLEIVCENNMGILRKISTALESKEVQIKIIEANDLNCNDIMEAKLLIRLPKEIKTNEVIDLILFLDGIRNVKIE